MNRLRSPGGCPWDAEQTHQSLVEYLIEEVYECVEAIEANDQRAMQEELGDILLQVVFHSRIAEPSWDIDDVIQGITTKLIDRHPHVFADAELNTSIETATDVEDSWHVRKAKEKGRNSLTEGIPEALPGLMRAAKLDSRTKSLGVPDSQQAELAENIFSDIADESELGDLFLEFARLARSRGWDAEASVRAAVRRRVEVIKKHELGN